MAAGYMCLGVPAKVVEVRDDIAIVDFGGIRREVDASLVDVRPGDLVIVHAGAIITKLSVEEYNEIVKVWEEMLEALEEEISRSGGQSRPSEARGGASRRPPS